MQDNNRTTESTIKPGHPFWGKSTADCIVVVLEKECRPMCSRDIYHCMVANGFHFATFFPIKTIDQHLYKLIKGGRAFRISRGVFGPMPPPLPPKPELGLRRGSRGIAPISLIGRRFGSLVALEITNRQGRGRHRYWHCLCDCGAEKEIRGDALLNGYHLSCGCGRRAASRERASVQGRSPNGRWEDACA